MVDSQHGLPLADWLTGIQSVAVWTMSDLNFTKLHKSAIVLFDVAEDEVAKYEQQQHEHNIQTAVGSPPEFYQFLEFPIGRLDIFYILPDHLQIHQYLLVGDFNGLSDRNGLFFEHFDLLNNFVQF